MGLNEKFLVIAKHVKAYVTPNERRLYFRTASAHLVSGCPFLALNVLKRLPKEMNLVEPDSSSLLNLFSGNKVLFFYLVTD